MRYIKANPFALLIFAAVVCAQSALAQDDSQEKDLPNFHKVNEQLYRGGQPTEVGVKQLVQQGIKTVINLRDDDERAAAAGAGILHQDTLRKLRPK